MFMPSFEERGIKIFIVWGNSFLLTQSTYLQGKRLEPSGLSPHGLSNHHHSCTLHFIGYTGRRASLVQNVVGKLKRYPYVVLGGILGILIWNQGTKLAGWINYWCTVIVIDIWVRYYISLIICLYIFFGDL
jgi:hypothetical protein